MLVSCKSSSPPAQICIGAKRIEPVPNFKLLGVTISQDITCRTHISNISSSARRYIGLLYRLFGNADSTTLSHLYKVLVRPQLDYASSIWDPPNNVHHTSLERVQNFAARVATSSWSRDTDPKSLKAELSWPLLHNRGTIQKISTFTKSQKPTKSYKNWFPLLCLFEHTSHHRSSFTIDVVDKWNSTSEHIVSTTSNM